MHHGSRHVHLNAHLYHSIAWGCLLDCKNSACLSWMHNDTTILPSEITPWNNSVVVPQRPKPTKRDAACHPTSTKNRSPGIIVLCCWTLELLCLGWSIICRSLLCTHRHDPMQQLMATEQARSSLQRSDVHLGHRQRVHTQWTSTTFFPAPHQPRLVTIEDPAACWESDKRDSLNCLLRRWSVSFWVVYIENVKNTSDSGNL